MAKPRNFVFSNRLSVIYCTVYFLLITAILLSATCRVGAQALKLKFKHINIGQGLSNSTIEAIYQDNEGFIWFGTRDGLNKYDGYQFRVYRNDTANKASISDNFIKCIGEDSEHNLWIGTADGLNRFNAYKNTFTRYMHNPLNKNSLPGNNINCIYKCRDGALIVGTNGRGLSIFDKYSNAFIHFGKINSGPNSIDNYEINGVFEDAKGNFWAATNNGLGLLNRTDGTINITFNLNGDASFQINYPSLHIQEDKQGNIWVGTINNGLLLINLNTHTFKHYLHNDKNLSSISTNLIRSLLVDNKGNVWAGGVNGSLDEYDPSKDRFMHAENDPNNSLSLSQKTASALFQDNQNNLWIGTHRGGVNFYAPLADKFKLFQEGESQNSLSHNDVKSFYEDSEGRIWIGTDDEGLNFYNKATNNFIHYRYNAYDSRSISSDAVLNIMEDKAKNLWISTWGGGLNLMDRRAGTFIHLMNNPNDANSISSNYVQAALQDSEGNYWVATYYGGLNQFDPKTRTFKRFINIMNGHGNIYGNNIISLNEDKDKNLWIGTDDGGLNCYDLINKSFSHYFINTNKTPDIRVIFTDSKGRVWVGQAGLYLFNKAQNKFSIYTDKGGLSTEFIKGITEDSAGNLWISTSNGLAKFNPDTREIKKYNVEDGLQGLEFEAGAYMKTRDGEMYFGGINGFNRFYPMDIKINHYVAPVYVTGMQIFNKDVFPGEERSPLKNDISLTHQVTLNYKQSAVSFDFAILNYAAAENNQYAYKLKGFDQDWQYTTGRKATYTNLNPGHYTFYVKASNNDGIWNNKSAYIDIDIEPPFWSTWWFRTFIILSGLTACYLLLRFKKNLDLHKIEENKRDEIHKIQLQFFTNISHEFRTPLSLILGPLEKIMNEDSRQAYNKYYDTIHRNANRLLMLINELLDFRKAESGSLKLKVMPGNLNLFVAEVAEDFQNLVAEKQISLNLLLQRNLGEVWFDRQIIEKIIINLIHNAYKYTNVSGEVTIELYTHPSQFNTAYKHSMIINNNYRAKRYVYIRVSDNGIGISKDSIHHLFERYYRITDAHMGSGVGLAFVKSLILIHKGSIHAYSEKNAGSDFIISLPIDKDDYSNDERWFDNADNGGVQLESIGAFLHQNQGKIGEHHVSTLALPIDKSHMSKILVVDDNDELRNFLHYSLDEFYNIVEAVDGIDGLEKVKAESPDMIISDLMMPRMNGIEFCRQLKINPATSQIPFIILSAKDALESKIEGAESGADLYFPKPVSINLLLLSIHNMFKQRTTLKETHIKSYFYEAQEATDAHGDTTFMDDITKVIESQLSNSDLDVDYVCREMGMSKTKLYHKIKKITGLSIGEFVRTFRLKKAAYIITHEDILLTDVMYRVGIQTQSYFTKAFKKEFGKTPSQFVSEIKTGRKAG